jgi:hypothetical protein
MEEELQAFRICAPDWDECAVLSLAALGAENYPGTFWVGAGWAPPGAVGLGGPHRELRGENPIIVSQSPRPGPQMCNLTNSVELSTAREATTCAAIR